MIILKQKWYPEQGRARTSFGLLVRSARMRHGNGSVDVGSAQRRGSAADEGFPEAPLVAVSRYGNRRGAKEASAAAAHTERAATRADLGARARGPARFDASSGDALSRWPSSGPGRLELGARPHGGGGCSFRRRKHARSPEDSLRSVADASTQTAITLVDLRRC